VSEDRAAGEATTLSGDEEPHPSDFDSFLRRVAAAPDIPARRGPPEEPLAVGTVVDGKLRIEGVLGYGGMGIVYEARHLRLSRRVAVKLTLESGPLATKRMLREARTMASIDHPNVIAVYDVGTFEGRVFIAMELLDGTVLDWLEHEARSWREVVAMFIDAGRGLVAAHRAQLVHRDFKPANLLVGGDGRVRVADFGLARSIDNGPREATTDHEGPRDALPRAGAMALTFGSKIVGTPAYMAPELYAGAPASRGTDQFAFCVSLFECLFGERPFRGRAPGALFAAIRDGKPVVPSSNPGVPARIRRALARGLSPEPSERFAGLEGVLSELAHDPRRRQRRIVLATLALGGTATVMWAGQPPAMGPCQGAGERVASQWTAERRRAIAGAFTNAEHVFGLHSWQSTEAVLERYAGELQRGFREACLATRVRDDQPPEVMDLRVACLDRLHQRFAATLEVMLDADADVVRHATAAAEGLSPVARCDQTERLLMADTVPDEQRDAVANIRARIAGASANIEMGRLESGRVSAETALSEALAMKLPVLIGEAHQIAAMAHARLRDWEQASKHAQAGLVAATAAHDDLRVAELATTLVYVDGYQRRSPDADRWLAMAKAYVERVDAGPELTSRLLSDRGLVERELGHLDRAIEDLEHALALCSGRETRRAIRFRGMLALAYAEAGRLTDASEVFDANLAAAERAFGPGHPSYAQELNNAAAVEQRLGHTDRAIAMLEQAVVIRTEVYGAEHPAVAEALVNLAALYDASDPLLAIRLLQRARAGAARASSPLLLPGLLGNLAKNWTTLGETETAIALFEEAIATGETDLGPGHRLVVSARYNLAAIERGRGNIGAANRLVRDALTAVDEAESEIAILPPLLLALRGALYLDADDARRALPDLRAAADELTKSERKDYPYAFDPLCDMGAALLALERPAEAVEALERAEAVLTDGVDVASRVELYDRLARGHAALGNRDAAREAEALGRRLRSSD